MRHQDPNLEHLRTLLILKNHVRSARFRALVSSLDNSALAEILERMSEAAEEDERMLHEIVRAWHEPEPPASETVRAPRDVVNTWAHVAELASTRLRQAAAAAPDARSRALLESMASRDEAHAGMLRSLL